MTMVCSYRLAVICIFLVLVLLCDGKLKVNTLTDTNNVSYSTCSDIYERPSLTKHKNFVTVKKSRLSELIESFPSVLHLLPVNSSNSQCSFQSKLILKGAHNFDIWALNFLDSWGKFPSGLLSGNGNQFGDFDQCISISGKVAGKYCLGSFDVHLPKQLHTIDQLIHSHYAMIAKFSDPGQRLPKFSLFQWGFCIPSACTAKDLEETLQNVLTQDIIKVETSISEELCYTSNNTLPGSQRSKIFALLFFIGLILLCILGTIYDMRAKKSQKIKYRSKLCSVIEAFSVPKNLKTLVDVKISAEDIPSLHGIRFLNAFALLLSHKHMALIFTPYVNRTSMSWMIGRAWATLGRTATVYTDSFILLSGLLTTMSLLKELNRKKKINLIHNVISRFIRLTPNLLVTIIFCTFLMPSLGSGPHWNLVVTKYAQLCNMYWWRNVLFIHNFFGFEEMCMTHTHQLGIDMQLFLISPLLVYCLWRWKKFGFFILVSGAVLSTVLRFIITFNRRLSLVVYFGIPISQLFATAYYSYILPTHRLTVYCIGISMGFYLYSNRKPIVLNKFQIAFGWTLCLSCGLLAMCGPYHMSLIGYVYSAYEAAIYSAFAPIVWSLFICWLIISSINGFGGWIGHFLQWKGFIIFTRISYAIYLTQFPIFFYNVGRKRTAEYYTIYKMFNFMEFGVIILVSVILSVMMDLPCQKLKKLLLTNFQDQTQGTVDIKDQNEIVYNQIKNEDDKSRLHG